MAKQDYEIIFAGDFREPSFRTTTAIDQLQAVATAGYRAGFLQLAGERAHRPARIHHDIRQLVYSGRLVQLDPNQSLSAKLLIAVDPLCFKHRPRRILEIGTAFRVILVAHGPTLASGQELYDWATVYQNANDVLAGDIIWAPMSTTVRDQIGQLDPRPHLSDVDWHASVDPAEWHLERVRFCSSRPIIGRSGQPVDEAWPNNAAEILSLYPDDPQFLVRILNGGPILKKHIGSYPRNWEVRKSEEKSEYDFLSSIDFFVYSHRPDCLNPIDPSLLRAMASGAVAILPPSYEPIFGDGAVYAEPHQIRSKAWALYANRKHYLALSEAGRQTIIDKFSPLSLISRINGLIGHPDQEAKSPVGGQPTSSMQMPRGRRRVIFMTINGVGMGHLTRMLAIAKRCPEPIEPVFITMSQALKVVREQGFLAEFIPSRQYLDCDINHWNGFLRDELNEMISFYDPAVVLFDGNVPYQGLVEAIKANPDPWFIWSRRGMWRSDSTDIASRERHFDTVLEPGDLAASDDHGITKHFRDRTHAVSPIRLLDAPEVLPRNEARAALGLDTDRPAVLIQLGAGNNFDFQSIYMTAIKHIQRRYDAQIAVGEWLISDQPIDFPETVIRMPGYPFARYFNAFDFAISAVGYNSFHELLYAGVPTILVPNEATEQDNQIGRALYADRHGLAVCVRTKEIYRLTATIDKFFLSDERDKLKSNLAVLDPANGAAEAASLINEMAYSRRVDRS